jgi:hypothetical protein
MDIDFSKRLCDATLGEYLAAERTVGIMSSWTVAALTAGFLLVARLLWKSWQTRKQKRAEAAWEKRYSDVMGPRVDAAMQNVKGER